MKPKSIKRLLQVGHFLFKSQNEFQRLFLTKQCIFAEEIQLIKEIFLIDMGLVWIKNKTRYIVNTDHYEYMLEALDNYWENQLPVEQMMDYIEALKIETVYHVVNGGSVNREDNTEVVNRLFQIKYAIQNKRNRLGHALGGECEFLRSEKEIINIALEELGAKRYFNQK